MFVDITVQIFRNFCISGFQNTDNLFGSFIFPIQSNFFEGRSQIQRSPRLLFLSILVGLYPCSTKTREVLGNPSPTPERFPETREISRGRSPREISRVEGNLEGRGDGFPNTSRVLVEHGQSLSINFSTGSGSENPSLWTRKD